MDNTTNNNNEKTPFLSVMGLWENTDKRGNKYLSGNLGGLRVMIFKNTFKQNEKEPDYRMSITQAAPRNRDEATDQTAQTRPNTTNFDAPIVDDDIPF